MDFAGKLAQHLLDKGMSQAELARRTSDHDPNVNAILRRRRPPQPERIASWATALGLSTAETAELQALAEAAYLQRKLDKEGAGRVAHVTQLTDGRYVINAIAGTGRDLVLLLPDGNAKPPAAPAPAEPESAAYAAISARLAALTDAHRRMQSAADDLAKDIAALRRLVHPGSQPAAPVEPESEEAWSRRSDRDLDQIRTPTEPDGVVLPPDRVAEFRRRYNLDDDAKPALVATLTTPDPSVSRRPRTTLKLSMPVHADTPP